MVNLERAVDIARKLYSGGRSFASLRLAARKGVEYRDQQLIEKALELAGAAEREAALHPSLERQLHCGAQASALKGFAALIKESSK